MLSSNQTELELFKSAYYKNNLETLKQIMTKSNAKFMHYILDDEKDILHLCGCNGEEDMLKMLLEEFNPDVNLKNWYDRTPASYAAKYNHFGCILLLLKHGANFKEDHYFMRDLDDYLAINYFCKNIPAVKKLVSFSKAANKINDDEIDYDNINYDQQNQPNYEELTLRINDNGKLQLEAEIDYVFDTFSQLLEFVSIVTNNTLTIKEIDGSIAVTGTAIYVF